MGIPKLNIFYIYKDSIDNVDYFNIIKPSCVSVHKINEKKFIEILENPNNNFIDFNKYSLYIFNNSNFLNIKRIFSKNGSYNINISKGGGQKAHLVSPLEIRLFSYLLAIFNCQVDTLYNKIAFDRIDKSKFIPFYNKEI